MEELERKIAGLEEKIAELPAGYISRKNIRGKTKLYHQWSEGGKKKSRYLDDESAKELERLIEERRALQQELRMTRALLPGKGKQTRKPVTQQPEFDFRTNVRVGEAFQDYIRPVRKYEKREGFWKLKEYLTRDYDGRVFILYGLRRTGKTTMIRQALQDMTETQLNRAAFIQVRTGITLSDIHHDLKWLAANRYQYVFLDEVTLAEDFIEGAALFSDIYASAGMKIVLSGTDSLGFLFSESEELYDRCVMLHTTWIPYREFERVLGIKGIDEYIRYGGTMSLGGVHYNETSTFATRESTDEYIDSAIARNIQHSLKCYQYGGHFRHLAELYERNELTSAINRVVEDINHRFTIEVLTRDFVSHDLGISAKNLRKDRENPTDILDHIDREAFTEGLRRALSILNQSEQRVHITDAHRVEIKEYLDLLDLTIDIPTEFIPVKNERQYRTAIAQPGMRYAQAEALIQQLLMDEEFQHISAMDRARVIDRILDEIRGRMMEDIVLLETRMAYPQKQVFRLQFAVGEFDMVVYDPKEVACEIYEIKHSTAAIPEQYRHLVDQQKCEAAEFRFGRIARKAVIYRGADAKEGEISYLNVEGYLNSLQ